MSRLFVVLVFAGALSPVATAQTATFTPLGALSSEAFYSVGIGVSDDGVYVVGASHTHEGVDQAFRWDSGNGMVPLGFFPGGYPLSVANAVSSGGIVAGLAAGFSDVDWQPSRFAYPSAPMNLGAIPGGSFNGNANGISADGTVIVGYTRLGNPTQAFRWTQQTGMVGLGNVLGEGGSSWGNAISSDGSTIVGWTSAQVNGGFGQCAFLWNESGGMVSLGDMRPVGALSSAHGVSSDGTYVVGEGTVAGGPNGYTQVAFRWHGFMAPLGWLPGGAFSRAKGVTSDGNTIVGLATSNSAHTWFGQEVFIWDPANGMRSFRDVLVTEHNLGAALQGWVLADVGGITPNGRYVVGTGFNPQGNVEAWRVDFGAGAASCYANCDESTTAPVLNVADFTCFLQRFAVGDAYANCDGSTTAPVLNVGDFTCFLQKFATGCP